MAKQLPSITPELETFIANQKMFFVATAMKEGRINLSPKGMDTLKVMGPNSLIWLNLTGSGNETAAQLLESDRMTIMFTAFSGKPLILRLYGKAKVFHERDDVFQKHIKSFPVIPGARQIIEMEVELVQTSCGFGVPVMEYKEERTQLIAWAEHKGKDGLVKYMEEKNSISLDGHETKILG